MKIQVKATEVRIGDKAFDISETDHIIVTSLRRVLTGRTDPSGGVVVDHLGGWVDITGDDEDGYYQKWYGEPESYYAYPLELITVERDA